MPCKIWMSDNILKFFPKDPLFTPSKAQTDDIRKFLISKFGKRHEWTIFESNEVAFIDQGGNFDFLNCPHCQQAIDIDWWQEKMEIAYQTKFEVLEIITPCCNTKSSLNDLIYDFPAGFAKFSIELFNPPDIEVIEIKTILSSILETPINSTWALI